VASHDVLSVLVPPLLLRPARAERAEADAKRAREEVWRGQGGSACAGNLSERPLYPVAFSSIPPPLLPHPVLPRSILAKQGQAGSEVSWERRRAGEGKVMRPERDFSVRRVASSSICREGVLLTFNTAPEGTSYLTSTVGGTVTV